MRFERVLLVAALLAGAVLPPPATAEPASAPGSAPTSTPASKPAPPRHNLRQLIAMARATYPGVEVAQHAIEVMESDLYRARWAWLPQGNVKGLVALAPEVRCRNGRGEPDRINCVQTDALNINSFNVNGVLARIDLEVGMPLYTFDKIGSAKRAAQSGVDIRKAQLDSTVNKLELDVSKAYWGLKLAREILYTLKEGRRYLTDAEKNIEKDLEEGEGDYTLTDLLRLKTARAEVDVRAPEADKLEQLTLAALAILTGQRGKPFDVDTTILEVLGGEPLPVRSYLEVAKSHRPELRLLQAAVGARNAAVDLERARFFPDFLFVAMVGYGYTSSIDDPQNAFYNDPFNYFNAGFGLALSWKLEPVLQWGAYRKARAEMRKAKAQRDQGELGVELDIRKAFAGLVEARTRLQAARSGQKSARRWLVATSQNLAAGLAETRDLTDALLGYFQLRLRYLQAMYDVNVGWSALGKAIGSRPRWN